MATNAQYTTEAYYNGRTTETERLIPPTIRLDTTPAYLPRDTRPLAALALLVSALIVAGILWRASIFAAGFQAGWAARELAGSLWTERGWAALVIFSIIGATVIVHGRNRTYAYDSDGRYHEH